MPELPEVQTVVNDLQEVIGQQITGFISTWPKAIKKTDAKKLAQNIVGKKIISIERIGKNIFINLSNNLTIGLHLKMTGKLLLLQNLQFSIFNFQSNTNLKIFKRALLGLKQENKHIHHLFFLNNHKFIAFSDVRKFATITLYSPSDVKELKLKLGIDPMRKSFCEKLLTKSLLRKFKQPIKQVIMDQAIVVGIGNIYASEILFDAKILPNRKVESLSNIEFKQLYLSTKKILAKAIRLRGTSVSDYRDANGKRGQFQNYLKVYKKHIQKCQSCDTIIEKTIIGQRSTFFCPNCQK